VKRTKLQGNSGVPRFFADKSKAASATISSTTGTVKKHDLVLDFKNLLIKSGVSLHSIVERAARLNGIFDKELVNETLSKVTTMLSGMNNVHVTLEEPATQIGRNKMQNYKFELALNAPQLNSRSVSFHILFVTTLL